MGTEFRDKVCSKQKVRSGLGSTFMLDKGNGDMGFNLSWGSAGHIVNDSVI